MTHEKLWVLKAHTKIHKMNDNCRDIRQEFDIYRNIDNQKAKKLKRKQKKQQTSHTNQIFYGFFEKKKKCWCDVPN